MNKDEMSEFLFEKFPRQIKELDPPSEKDWKDIEEKFQCKMPESYKIFQSVLIEYQIPIEIYNISSGRSNGDDLVSVVFDIEVDVVNWDLDLIPICGLGNGDYYCFKASEGDQSAVYFYDHGDESVEKSHDTFDGWVRDLGVLLDTEEN